MDFASKTTNTRRLGAVGLATLFALLSGCFSEPTGGETGATGGDCDEGSFGCECLAGACEPELVCTPSNICIAENCTPGTAICECDDQGRCGPGLECTTNVCLPMGGTTITTTSTDSNTTTSTSTTGSSTMPTTMPADTETSTTDPDTETSATDPDTTGSSTGDPETCIADGLDCPMCFSCTNTIECQAEFSACTAIDGCTVAASCIADCTQGPCFEDCCAGRSQALTEAAEALTTCRRDTCIQSSGCRSFADVPAGFCGE